MRTRSLALLALFLAPALACGGQLECGPGTAAEDGVCVSKVVDPTCGEGSTFDAESGECRAAFLCGPGTTFDPATSACAPEAVCGEGTALQPETGLCVPETECGPGTVLDTSSRTCVPATECGEGTLYDPSREACIPDAPCGPGTRVHPVTLRCVPEIICGPGTVAIASVCRPVTDLLADDADLVEPQPDDNDPAFGGAPTALTLEPVGESVIVDATIGRPVDLDGDLVEDQDRDFYAFTGAAGQRLRVRVIDRGLPQPAFRMTGPDGYLRTSRLGVVPEADRELVLPADGEYRVEVGTVAVLTGEATALIGSRDHGYLLIIEELPWPARRPLEAPGVPEVLPESGSTLGLGFYEVQTPAADLGVTLHIATAGRHTEPELLLFSAESGFLGRAGFAEDNDLDAWVLRSGAWSRAAGDLLVVIDWVTSTGFDNTHTVEASSLAPEAALSVAADTTAELPRVTIAGERAAAFALDAAAGQLLSLHLDGVTRPEISLATPSAVHLGGDLVRGQMHLVTDAGGAYRLLVVNPTANDAHLSLGVRSQTLVDLGVAAAGQGAVDRSGPDLLGDRRFGEIAAAQVEAGADLLLEVRADFRSGMPDLELYRVRRGLLVDRRFAGEDELGLIRGLAQAGDRFVAVLDPAQTTVANPAVRGWSLRVDPLAIPELIEVEPNDDSATALPVAPGERVLGQLEDNAVDVYRLELDPPLAEGERVRVVVEDLDRDTRTTLDLKGPDFADLRTHRTRRLSAQYAWGDEVSDHLFIELTGDGAPYRYLLEIERAADGERASNPVDTPLAVPAGEARFGRAGKNTPDYLRVEAPAGASHLLVRARNPNTTSDLEVTAFDGAGQPFATTVHEDAQILAPVTDGAVLLEVRGRLTSSETNWRVDAVAVTGVVPRDNDSQVEAVLVDLGTQPVRLLGQEVRGAADFYRVTLDPPLAPGESLRVQWANELDLGDIEVHLEDATGPIGFVEEHTSEIAVQPQGALFIKVVPDGTATRLDYYSLELSRLARDAEAEPNDAELEAQALAIPARLRGGSHDDDLDQFSLTAPASGLLHVELSAKVRLRDLSLRVLDGQGNLLHEGLDLDHAVELAVQAGEQLRLEVQSVVSISGEQGVYDLDVTLE